MKTQLGISSVYAISDATAAAGADVFLEEIDTHGSQNGTLLLWLNTAAGSDFQNVEVWTSSLSDFGTSGSALSAVASDGTAQVVLTSDAAGVELRAEALQDGTDPSDLTVSGNTVSKIDQTGLYAFTIRDCARYLKVQYDSDGVGSEYWGVFVGTDLLDAPWAGERSAY